jgi:hypothetical protein
MNTPADTSITSKVTSDLNWVKHHLILIVIVGLLVYGGVFGVESVVAKHDALKDAQWKAVVAADQQRLATDEANWQQQFAALSAQNTQLLKAMEARDAAAAIQQKKDASLSATEAAQRLSEQTKAAPGEVTAQGNNLLVDLPISRGIVTSLDQLPAVQADLADTKTQLANETTIAGNAQKDVADLKQKSIDQDKACQAQIADVKSQARKSKTKIATIALGVGIVVARLLGI